MNLDNINLDQLELQLENELSKDSFSYFVKSFWEECDQSKLVWNWHIEYMCNTLEAVFADKIQHCYIAVPPGSGKSMIVSVMFPVWVWINDPTQSFISTGHTMKLNQSFCEKSLRLLNSPRFKETFPQIQIDPKAAAKASYREINGGSRNALSFGSLTGSRANYILVDDPITINGAKSKNERESVNEIFSNALQSRLNDPAKDHIIVIAQRTHVMDVVGVIHDKKMNYEEIVIPMEYTGDKIINKKLNLIDPRNTLGELLFPERFPQEIVDNFKKSMNKLDYITQYLQNPVASDGNFFDIENIQYYNVVPDNIKIYLSSDNAVSGKGDYNVVTVWGVDIKGDYYLLDWFREKCKLLDQLGIDDNNKLKSKGIIPFIDKYHPIYWYAENDNNFKAVEQVIRDKLREMRKMVSIKPISPNGANKEIKAQSFQLAVEQSKVYFPTYIDKALIEELHDFPLGVHDDFVDACATFFRANVLLKPQHEVKIVKKGFDYEPSDDDNLSLYS